MIFCLLHVKKLFMTTIFCLFKAGGIFITHFRDKTPNMKRTFWMPPQGSKPSHSAGKAEAIVMSKQDDNYFCCNEIINKL